MFSRLYFLIMIFVMLIIVYVGFFLHANFYIPMQSLGEIVVLQEGSSGASINITKFNKILEKLDLDQADVEDEVYVLPEDEDLSDDLE